MFRLLWVQYKLIMKYWHCVQNTHEIDKCNWGGGRWGIQSSKARVLCNSSALKVAFPLQSKLFKSPLTVILFNVEAKRVGENTDCLVCQSHVAVRYRYLVLAKRRLCAWRLRVKDFVKLTRLDRVAVSQQWRGNKVRLSLAAPWRTYGGVEV